MSSNISLVEGFLIVEYHRVEHALMEEDFFSLLSSDKLWEVSWTCCSDSVGLGVNEPSINVELDQTGVR